MPAKIEGSHLTVRAVRRPVLRSSRSSCWEPVSAAACRVRGFRRPLPSQIRMSATHCRETGRDHARSRRLFRISGLNPSQRAQLYDFLADYKQQSADQLLIRAPSGGPNETAAMRAYDDVRAAMRHAGIKPSAVAVQPYYFGGDPAAPIRVSFLQVVAVPPDCPDWSENIARDPQNMPFTNMGCATQRNLAVAVANPRDLIDSRGETPRSSERRDVVWSKYVNGQPTISKRAPSEHANASEVSPIGGSE